MILPLIYLQLQTNITDKELARIAQRMSCKKLKTVAVRYLGLTKDDLENMEEEYRRDKDELKRNILRDWRNRNPGQNARVVRTFIHKSKRKLLCMCT